MNKRRLVPCRRTPSVLTDPSRPPLAMERFSGVYSGLLSFAENPSRLRLLLQAKLFSGRQQCDRFANASFARFQSFSCVNPNDEVTTVGGRQLAKESPCFV